MSKDHEMAKAALDILAQVIILQQIVKELRAENEALKNQLHELYKSSNS